MATADGVASPLPHLESFIFTEKLGEGTYASVYKAYRKGNRREVVAIKCIRRTSLNKRSTENLMTEIELLKRLKHRHIVELYDFEWDSQAIYLVMEFCSGGDLSAFIKSRRTLPERVARKFLRQLALALKFLRDRNISHMDLKPQNLLLSSQHNPVLKIGDFGFAQYLKAPKDSADMRGSPLYMAPEMFVSDQYTCLVDLWSVGVILYEALYGVAPFASSTWTELEEKIKDDRPIELPDVLPVSSNCRDLLTGLLQRDAKQRMTFSAFFDHPFIDLEHMPAPDSLNKACSLVTKAVQKDTDGDFPYAAQLYCAALDYFLPAIRYEEDEERKATLREKIKQYIDRVEHLKSIIKKATREPQSRSAAVEATIRKHEALRVSINKIKEAEKADDHEQFQVSLQLYQDGLEGVIKALPRLQHAEQEPLRAEVEQWLKRAEEIKLFLEIQTSKKEADFEPEKAFSVKAKECVIQ